ncbi:hypothetical protein LguiA_029904 [Lonicera macranthoides]
MRFNENTRIKIEIQKVTKLTKSFPKYFQHFSTDFPPFLLSKWHKRGLFIAKKEQLSWGQLQLSRGQQVLSRGQHLCRGDNRFCLLSTVFAIPA